MRSISPCCSNNWSAYLFARTRKSPPTPSCAVSSWMLQEPPPVRMRSRTSSTCWLGVLAATLGGRCWIWYVKSGRSVKTISIPSRSSRDFSTERMRELALNWRASSSSFVPLRMFHVSSTAARMALVPRKVPVLVLWWITTMVQAGKSTPLRRASCLIGLAYSRRFSSYGLESLQPSSESITTKSYCPSFCIRQKRRYHAISHSPMTSTP